MGPQPPSTSRAGAARGASSCPSPSSTQQQYLSLWRPGLLLMLLLPLLLCCACPGALAFHPSAPAQAASVSAAALRSRRGLVVLKSQPGTEEDGAVGRRESLALGGSLAAAVGAVVLTPGPAQALRPPSPILPPPEPSPRPHLWQVLMSDPPQLQPYTPDGQAAVLRELARTCNAVLLGEHPDSAKDHALQAEVIAALGKYKPRDANVAVGLEMVQQQFQPALDAYVAKAIPDEAAAEQALAEATEWGSRWPVPLEMYLPVLRLAREQGYPLLALGIDSEALSKVQAVGLEGLSEAERGVYVADPSGFIQSVKLPAFKLYAERFILPAYQQRLQSGGGSDSSGSQAPSGQGGAEKTTTTPTSAKFLASRILWDESMATKAVRHLQDKPRDIVVLLVAADHVKFGMGAPARLERLLRAAEVKTAPGRGKVRSVLLNANPDDTGSQTRRLRLTLGYAANLDKARPVADYLLYSTSPKVAWLEHPQNPVSRPYSDNDVLFQVFPDQR